MAMEITKEHRERVNKAFEQFWNAYIPTGVKSLEASKGSKEDAYKEFWKFCGEGFKNPDYVMYSAERYLAYCFERNYRAVDAKTFLRVRLHNDY